MMELSGEYEIDQTARTTYRVSSIEIVSFSNLKGWDNVTIIFRLKYLMVEYGLCKTFCFGMFDMKHLNYLSSD